MSKLTGKTMVDRGHRHAQAGGPRRMADGNAAPVKIGLVARHSQFAFGVDVSFGHAAFFGLASYVSAYTAKFWGVTPEAAILLGTAR